MPTIRRLIGIAAVLAVAIPGAALPALAQAPAGGGAAVGSDARWLPWMGCWRLWEEQFEQAPDGSELPGPMVVCLTPDPEGARMTARAGDEVFVERTLAADGIRREVSDGECRGWERREWSADGRRIFTSAEIRCDEAGPVARSGMSFLSDSSTWVDVQVVDVEEQQHLEIRRYNPAPGATAGTAESARLDDIRQARRESAVPPGLNAVREAAAKADARVVEALLTETEPRLQIDRDILVDLDDAGIDPGVIDLLVALAYPERFVVERRRSGRSGGGWSSTGGGFAYDPFSYGAAYPYYMTPFGYYGYMRYGGLYGGPYSPYYGYPYGGGGGGNPFIQLGGGDTAPPGGAVKGLGYTRVRQRTAVDNVGAAVPVGGGGGTSTARPRGGGGSSPPRVGSSGGGGATRGGYSGRSGGSSSGGGQRAGGSSSGGGRSAVPRR